MNGGLNVFDLIKNSSLPVQGVLLTLLVFSFMSWVIMIRT